MISFSKKLVGLLNSLGLKRKMVATRNVKKIFKNLKLAYLYNNNPPVVARLLIDKTKNIITYLVIY